MGNPMRVVVWNENIHERSDEQVRRLYPQGIHGAITEGLHRELRASVQVRTATLEQPDHGLPQQLLEETDVLLWWGHAGHQLVDDTVVERIHARVLEGMGLLVLHSAHLSKIFRRLMGTSCNLRWRHRDREVVWCVNPGHPIAEGVPPVFLIPEQEMYGEYFDIPAPDELIFISSFGGGEVFRSGCCFRRGRGRIFYFSPGHEENPVYHQAEIRRVLANGVRWAYQPLPSEVEVGRSLESPSGWFAPPGS
jgi:trehalose utilization protein